MFEFDFKSLRCGAYWTVALKRERVAYWLIGGRHLKERDAYWRAVLKRERRLFQWNYSYKILNLVIFSFQK